MMKHVDYDESVCWPIEFDLLLDEAKPNAFKTSGRPKSIGFP